MKSSHFQIGTNRLPRDVYPELFRASPGRQKSAWFMTCRYTERAGYQRVRVVYRRVRVTCVCAYLGFAAGTAPCGRVGVVGRISFGEGDGLVAAKRVCHGDEAAGEAAHRSFKLDGFLRVRCWGVHFGEVMSRRTKYVHEVVHAAFSNG